MSLSDLSDFFKPVIPGGGGPHQNFSKNHQKCWFFKSCDTLTTIQLREKTQLTKVVSPLKRFGRHLSGREDNRIFRAKISVTCSSFSCRFGGGGLLHQSMRFFTLKMRLAPLSCKWRPNLFRSETTLVSCVFPRSWIVVKVWQQLKNQHFHDFLKNFGGGAPTRCHWDDMFSSLTMLVLKPNQQDSVSQHVMQKNSTSVFEGTA